MPNFFNDLENNNQNNNQDNSKDFWKQQNETQNAVEATRLENKQRYGVDISDEEYACYNDLIANSKNPDEEAHKIGTAILFSNNLGITRDEAYANLEQYKKAYWDDDKTTSYRKWYEVTADSLKMGANNVRIGMLGMELMSAQKDGNEERVNALLQEYSALKSDNEQRYDNAPRTWATNCLKDGMQSLPYSMAAGGAAMFGSFILPGVGTAMSFGLSSTLMAGQEYIDALNEGIRPEIARQKALISGTLQGAVEAALDPIVGAAGGTVGKITGKAVFTKPTEQLIEKLTTSLQRKFHFGKAGKIALNALFEYLKSLPMEGAEEFIQQEISENIQNSIAKKENEERAKERSAMLEFAVNQIGEAVREDLQKTIEAEYPDLEIKTQGKILDDSIEAFKGGVRGAIVLGLIPGAAKGIATEIDYLRVKQLASTVDSETMFNKIVEETTAGQNVKKEFNEKQQETLWHDVWTDAQKEKERSLNTQAKEIAEVNPANEGYEQAEIDEETGDIIAKAPYRKDNGELDTQDIKTGSNTYSFRAGDSTKKDKNLYGNIEYTKDTENKTITINSFEMAEQREGLRNEFYDSFAKTNAGYVIKWDNVIGERAKEARQALIDANPRGSANGLNYYEDAIAIKNTQATKEVTGKIKSIFESHNKTISDEELSHFAALTQMAYNSLADKQLQDLNAAGINNYADFMETIRWGNEQDLETELNNRGSQIDLTKVQGMTIQANMQEIAKGAKAIIYVGQNGDFSTLVHEFTHFLRGVYTDEAIADVAEAIGVKKENGKYNWTTEDEEKLAYNFEQYLNGNFTPETTGVKNFFDNLAKFMTGAIAHMKNFIQLTPQIIEAYDSLLKADNSVLKNAENAVKEMEAGRRAKEIADQQRKDFEEKKRKAQEEKLKETEKATITAAEEQALNDDLPLNAEEKAAAEEKVKQEERIVKNVKADLATSTLSDAVQEAVSNIITNPETSLETKTEIADAIAKDAYKDQEGLFQLIGIESVKQAARNGYRRELLEDAKKYEEMNKKGSDFRRYRKELEEDQIQAELKRITGFETVNDKVVYETEDGFNHLIGTTKFNALMNMTPGELAYYSDKKELLMQDYVVADELYQYYPVLKDARLQFYIKTGIEAPIGRVTAEGIAINLAAIDNSSWKNVNGVMGIMSRQLQNLIFAIENSNTEELRGLDYKSIYEALKNKAKDLDIDTTFYEVVTKTVDRLKNNKLQQLSLLCAKRLCKSTEEKRNNTFETNLDVIDHINNKLYGRRALMQQIGELGATALDAAEETAIRMDNNKIAKKMESAGKDPKTIRLATGWERGVDGLWKYEISDFKLKEKPTWTLEENENGDYHYGLLSDLIYAPELFKAYPKLRNYTVHTSLYGTGMLGEYSEVINDISLSNNYERSINFERQNKINNLKDTVEYKAYDTERNELIHRDVNTEEEYDAWEKEIDALDKKFDETEIGRKLKEVEKTPRYIETLDPAALNTLIHEVQHAIQNIEGFAAGGAPGKIFYNVIGEYRTLKEQVKELDPNSEEFKKKQNRINELDNIMERESEDEFKAYQSLAGEVEARNAETRMNLTAEERLNTLLTETMDIAPEDQIVMFESVRMASEELNNEAAQEELRHDPLFQEVTDPAELEWLNNQETVKAYRTMQLHDGKLYPPMAGKVKNKETGKTEWQKPLELNKWERSEERPDLADDNGDFTLNKGNGKSIKAAYAPYFHSSQSMLNDQFKEAQDRPELVVVEVEVPVSELNGIDPYTALKAKKSVGPHEWPAGVLRNQMEGKRYVNLSRWDKVVRVVPNEEVVASIDKMFKDNGFNKDIPLPTNVFTPQVKEGLENAGWKFIKTDNHDKVLEGEKAGLTYTKAYAKKEVLYQELDDQTLYGVHNISEAGLKHAFDMGGLANPSMAVVDKNIQGLEGFGDISLIALASTINKSTGGNAGTFGADIYSPRYPSIKTFVTDYGRKDIEKIFNKVTEKYPEISKELIYGMIDRIETSSRSITGENLLYTNLPIAYLAEKGNDDFIQTTQPKNTEELISKYKAIENKNIESPEMQQLYKDYMLDYWLSRAKKDPEYSTNKEEVIKDFTKFAEEDLQKDLDDNGLVAARYIYPFQDQLERDLNNAGKIDRYQTESKAKEIIRNDEDLKKDFISWATDKMAEIEKEEKIFNGFTPSGNRRYLSHTLENVSKYMKQQGLKGGESFSYGFNSTRALLAPKWTTLAQIRKNKDRLATSEQVEKAREELKDYYNELTDKLRNGLSDFDAGEARLQEAYSTPGVDPLIYLEEEYGINFTEEEAEDFRVFTDALKNLPTKYFETKWEKPIYTENFGSTFAAAVVPNTIDPKLKEKLEKNYLYVFEYDPNEEGAKFKATKAAVEDVGAKRKVLFQTVYHGTAADFEEFNTDKYGLSGEGSMTFGYGTYLTNAEEIARDYADRQVHKPYRKEATDLAMQISNKSDYLRSRKQALKGVENQEKYEAKILKNLNNEKKELAKAVKAKDESEIKFYNDLIKISEDQLKPETRLKLVEDFTKEINDLEEELKQLKKRAKEIEKIEAKGFEGQRKLYSVDIPDNGYLQWDKVITQDQLDAIAPAYADLMAENMANGDYSEEWKNYTEDQKNNFIQKQQDEIKNKLKYDETYTGGALYDALVASLPRSLYPNRNEAKKVISKFLSKIGYIGIEYPAGTIHGNGQDARNFVIFDDKDAVIIQKVLFQTQDELYADARMYDTWQDFMDAYTMDFNPLALEDPSYHDQVPSDADAQFYQSVWEMAHAMQTEESLNEEEVKQQEEKDTSEAAAQDAFFVTKMTNDPDMLDDFLKRAAEIDSIDFGSDDYVNPADEEEELKWQKLEAMQDYIRTQLSHGSWISNGKRLLNGKEITDSQRQRIISLIKAAPRDYRAVYAEIMEAPYLKVEYKDSVAAKLEKNARKYKLVNPNEDIERMSPEKRRKLADMINDAQVKEKIRSGKMKLDDEVTAYIKSLEKQAKDAKKEVEDLEAAQSADYKTIADWETRRLLELNKKLLEAKSAYEKSNDKITREIAKGIKISDKYRKQVQNLKGNYDEIFRKFEDLRSVITINAKVQEMLDRQEKIKKAKGKVGKIEDEAEVMRQVKALRVQLVKRTMRRVPFDRIAYDEAKAIIAIQRMLEPNLLGGVNRWISTEGAILRNVISGILTDEDYKNQIMAFVKANRKSSEASNNFIQKLSELKSIEDYEKWDEKTKKYAIKHLPKENWIRDLNLKELAKEREEAIDLDIEQVEEQTPLKNDDGEIVYQPFYEKDGVTIVKDPKDPKRQVRDDNGNVMVDESGATIYLPVYDNTGTEVDPDIKRPYTLTTFKLKAPEDIRQLVKDNVGADLYDAIVNRPFADWSTEDLEKLAIRINNLYKEGRDKLAATKQLRREAQQELRDAIEAAAKNTGITINPDDPEDVKKKKQEKINKILGIDNALKGTKNVKKETKLNRFLHGYADANVRRVARILDNYSEGTNTDLLYWREDECYNNKQRTIKSRVENINKVLEENKINLNDLYKEVEVDGRKFTVDELLFFLAADEDFINDPKLEEKGFVGLDANDDYAATSRNAVMFGNMLSDTESLEIKQELEKEDQKMIERIESGKLSTEEKNLLTLGNLVRKPGTYKYIKKCKQRYKKVLAAARQVENSNGYEALRKAIAEDYAAQYDRMNEVSIAEYNTPVHRVKCYVPMYRLESNGDTNENQVRADLLATAGADSTRSWVNKGMTKRRTNIAPIHQKPVSTGLYKTWTDSTEKTEHFIAYSGYVRDLNAVYKSRDANYLRQFIENRYGKGMINYVDEYISEIANPNANKVRTAADEIVRTLRGKTAPAYLSWKASSILKQAMTSPWPYMQFVDPATYIAACFKCMQPGTMDAIKAKSVFMAQRRFDPMADLTDEMADKARNKFDSFMAKTSQIGMAGLEMIDWVCVAPGWLACYEKEYARLNKGNDAKFQAIKRQLEEDRAYYQGGDKYMSNEEIDKLAEQTLNDAIEYEAIRYADDCVRLCQPSNRSVDISPLFKNSSEAWKAYLQFQTSLNVIWQNIRYDIPYAVRQKQFKQVVGMILGYTFAGIAMNFLMEGAGNGADDDDKEKQIARDLIYYSTTQFTDAIPLVGAAVTSANSKIITGRSGYTQSGTDMTPMLTKFIKVGENAIKGATYASQDEQEKARQAWIKACTNFGEGVGMYLGLPTQGVKEITKLAGVGDNDGKVGLHLENVYGSLDPIANKVYGDK